MLHCILSAHAIVISSVIKLILLVEQLPDMVVSRRRDIKLFHERTPCMGSASPGYHQL